VDGGSGGSVVLVASPNLNSLLSVGRRFSYKAESGRPGTGSNKSGRSGEDLEIEVPIGTQIFDRERGNLLRDLAKAGDRVVAARGGGGGKGNARFATSVRQAPRIATPGESGERRTLRLELKLFAEVGLVGLPNAGKSTLLASVTAATPKIADYPFTTLAPEVGIARVSDTGTLVLADLPGLIEGASEGHGLGHRFLRHVERCRVIVQLVDVVEDADADPSRPGGSSTRSSQRFSADLARRPRSSPRASARARPSRRARELEEEAGAESGGSRAPAGRPRGPSRERLTGAPRRGPERGGPDRERRAQAESLARRSR
jgi:GTP-binding protein